jgi:hypothetical protein
LIDVYPPNQDYPSGVDPAKAEFLKPGQPEEFTIEIRRWRIAGNSVYFGGIHASQIVLPVIR